MKLKSYLLLMCMVAFVLACSNNDEPVEQPKLPVVTDANLTLAVQTADKALLKTLKADTDGGTASSMGDGTIKTLTVVVFAKGTVGGAYDKSGYKAGDIVFTATKPMTEPGGSATLTDIGLAADDVEMLLVANAEKDWLDKVNAMTVSNSGTAHNKKNDVLAIPTSLVNENEYIATSESKSKGLTMSKYITGIALKSGNNKIGTEEADDLYEGKIELERTVARVELNSLSLTSSTNYASKSFELMEVFVANVKSASLVSGDKIEVALTEANKDKLYHVGAQAWTDATGAYKQGKAVHNPNLSAHMQTVLAKKDNEVIKENETVTLNAEALKEQGNKYFYVYTNQNGERTVPSSSTTPTATEHNYTLLVVKGNYTHLVKGQPVTETDRYYTVVVNDDDFGAAKSDHVQRNTKYWIRLTISGSGSDTPYDPAAYAHIAANIKVTPWAVIQIEESVD